MWACKPKDTVLIHHFFHSTQTDMWTRLFKSSEDEFPSEGHDLGFEAVYDALEVIFRYTGLYFAFT